ncbi:hypothetical protein [Maribellus sp. YY47]|uniref:hypothetical protein n=1 Tax=Maribellus sp. YY47 TaxID=2929486 RepID=UPI002001344D|nr:hypothetical protein [Maribellus sp. YY47]MCK3685416.1 hypothetical protein [Maribellus sp. YY47]
MAKVIVTAKVKDTTAWEAGFRSVSAFLSTIYVSPVVLGINIEDSSFAYSAEVRDLDQFLVMINSERIQKLQEENGVIAGTVKFYVLDRPVKF